MLISFDEQLRQSESLSSVIDAIASKYRYYENSAYYGIIYRVFSTYLSEGERQGRYATFIDNAKIDKFLKTDRGSKDLKGKNFKKFQQAIADLPVRTEGVALKVLLDILKSVLPASFEAEDYDRFEGQHFEVTYIGNNPAVYASREDIHFHYGETPPEGTQPHFFITRKETV